MKFLALFVTLSLASCGVAQAPAEPTPVYGYEVVATYPHDPNAFTQGLFWRDGLMFESTGLEGQSFIRKVRLETGEVLMHRNLASRYFGEGIVDWKDKLVQLTWQNRVGFSYDIATFQPRGQFQYSGEGWALTRDDKRIIMSDGTSELRFLDPETLAETGRITVTDGGAQIAQLNELEWVKGEVFANIWQTDRIARIDPTTGKVTGWIDLKGILKPTAPLTRQPDVLNGIAYDAAGDRLFVTGKFWPAIYQIKLVRKPAPN